MRGAAEPSGDFRLRLFIDKVTVAGRMSYGYRFGVMPQ
jgi:hypothetical protein